MVMQNLQKMYNTCYVIVNMFIVLKITYILVISVYFDKCKEIQYKKNQEKLNSRL